MRKWEIYMLSPLSFDTDSFENIIEEYRSRIVGIFPDWTNYNYSDPGITILELFAWLRENQQYFMEQLGDDHYREFFRLAGFNPYGRTCARFLAEAVPGENRGAVTIPAGTRFLSGALTFETTQKEFIPAAVIKYAKRVNKSGRTEFTVGRGQIVYQDAYSFTPFGRESSIGTCMLIGVAGDIPKQKEFRLALSLLPNVRNPEMEDISENLTELKWEYISGGDAYPLTVVSDETRAMLYSGRITFRIEEGPGPENDHIELKATLVSGTYDISPVITGMSLSQIELAQTESYDFPDGYYIGEGNGFPDQIFELPQKSFLADSIQIESEDPLNPGKMIRWSKTDDFLSCGPEDRCFLPDEDAGTVRFGNGWHGLPPQGKISLKAVTGSSGSAGNVKIGSVLYPKKPFKDDMEFSMIKLISPGRDPETREETLLRIIQEKDMVQRAVSLSDYEQLVMKTPGLCIHSCHAWTEDEDPTTVHIAVRPGDGNHPAVLSETERTIIGRYLDDKRLIGMKTRLHTPDYIRVDITVEAVPSPKYRNAMEVLKKEILDWFGERKAIYGEPLSYNQLLSRLDALPCITRVLSLSMEPLSAGIGRTRNGALIPPVGGVFLPGRIEVILNHYQAVQ